MAAPFTLCTLTINGKQHWYALFRDPATGKRLTKKSVDRLRTLIGMQDKESVTEREEAESICQTIWDRKLLFQTKEQQKRIQEKGATLATYLSTFYDWDKSPYIQHRLVLDGGSLSKDYLHTRKNLIDKQVVPLLDATLTLGQVTLADLEDLQFKLAKSTTLSKTTINMAMQAVLFSLKEAQRRNLIPREVVLEMKPLKATHRIRGILTEQETKDYLAYAKTKKNRRIWLSAMLSLLTGMRSGELRALTPDQIKGDLIVVDRAYADTQGTKTPKGKKTRIVPCPSFLCKELVSFSHTNPYRCKETLVFWSPKNGGHVSSHYFCELFHETLRESGIMQEEEIKRRYITFHSFRHMANTLLRGSVDEYVLRLTIGHSSEQLSDIYTHLSDQAFKSVQQAQAHNILPLAGMGDAGKIPSDNEPSPGSSK